MNVVSTSASTTSEMQFGNQNYSNVEVKADIEGSAANILKENYFNENQGSGQYDDSANFTGNMSVSNGPRLNEVSVANMELDPVSDNVAILVCFVTIGLSLLTTGGNLLVIAAFRVNKKLQTITNYFILSLACADVVVGLISMNLFTTFVVKGGWTLGPIVCDFWLTVDYVASNASVMNLLIICVDRYLAITKPLTYRTKRTKSRARKMIAGAWILSFFLWAPAILLWPIIEGKRSVEEHECHIQFIYTSPMVTFGTALAAFYIPTAVMITLNWKIYRVNVQHQRYRTAFKAVSKWRTGSSNATSTKNYLRAFANSSNRDDDKRSEEADEESGEMRKRLSVMKEEPEKLSQNMYETTDQATYSDMGEGTDNNDGTNEQIQPMLKSNVNKQRIWQKTSDPFDLLSEVMSHALMKDVKLSKKNDHLASKGDADDVIKSLHYDGLAVTVTSPTSENNPSEDEESDGASDVSEEVSKPFLSLAFANGLGVDGARIAFQPSASNTPITKTRRNSPLARSVSADAFRPGTGENLLAVELNKKRHMSERRASSKRGLSRCTSSASEGVAPTSSSSSSARLSDVTALFAATSKNVKDRISAVSRKDNKAARMLAAILIAFVATWLPYNILVLVSTLCESCVNDTLWKISYWLCYLNSTINPLCYALCSEEFRKTFRKLLCCNKEKKPKI
ncbi:muscarinic acetylcholine receptor M2-like [Styela clava]